MSEPRFLLATTAQEMADATGVEIQGDHGKFWYIDGAGVRAGDLLIVTDDGVAVVEAKDALAIARRASQVIEILEGEA